MSFYDTFLVLVTTVARIFSAPICLTVPNSHIMPNLNSLHIPSGRSPCNNKSTKKRYIFYQTNQDPNEILL